MSVYARRAFVVLLASVVLLVIAAVVTWHSLPGAVAMFWTIEGHPRGHVPRLAAVIILIAVPLACAAVTATCPRLNLVPGMRAGFMSVGLLVSVATTLRAVYVLSVNAAYGSAVDIPGAVNVLAAIFMVVVALLAALYTARSPASPDASRPPEWRAGPADRPLWRGAATAPRPTITSIVYFAIGFGALYIGGNAVGLTVFIGGIVGGAFILPLTAIVVDIDQREFRVRYFGGTRWPVKRIPTVDIQEVELADIDPPKSGGWGSHGNLRRQQAAVLNVRRGPGLRLKLDGGKRFLITVDDPEGAIQVLRQLVTKP